MPKRTSAVDATPIRVVVVTMDSHLSGAVARAQDALARGLPGLELVLHGADVWGEDPAALERCCADIATGDIVVATMLFLDDHIRAVLPSLAARRDRGSRSTPDRHEAPETACRVPRARPADSPRGPRAGQRVAVNAVFPSRVHGEGARPPRTA